MSNKPKPFAVLRRTSLGIVELLANLAGELYQANSRAVLYVGRSSSRRWHLSSALCAAPVAVVSVFRAVPAPWPAPVVQLVAFTPWFVLPAGAALVLALPARRPWAALPAAALLALQLLWLFPPDRVADRLLTRQAAELKVMTLNAWKGQADAAEVVRLVRENGVGLLAVQELSPALERRLDAEGRHLRIG